MNFVTNLDWDRVGLPEKAGKNLEVVHENGTGKKGTHSLSALIAKRTEYEGFGSFRSKNVEELIGQKRDEYSPPSVPIMARRILTRTEMEINKNFNARENKRSEESKDVTSVSKSDKMLDFPPKCECLTTGILQGHQWELATRCDFGVSFRKEHFLVSPEIIFINHGAFGGALAGALEIKHQLERLMENEVVDFFDRVHLPLVVYSTRRLCEHFNASYHQLVLLQNATFGMNSALRIIEKGDVVAYFDTEYLAVYKALWYRCKEVGITPYEISVNKYLHDEEVLGDDEAFSSYICTQLPPNCSALVLDHISSTSGMCFPIFSHLIPAVRGKGVKKIIVDGAHAPLQVEINFNSLSEASRPTIYMGNLHKWFCAPKSVGFLWACDEYVSRVSSVIRSHGAGDGFLSEFIWDGTKDYGSYFTIPALIDFWNAQDILRVHQYCSGLLDCAVDMLTNAFRSRKVARHAPFMSLVELPEPLQPHRTQEEEQKSTKNRSMSAVQIQDILRDFFAIEVPVKEIEGRYYVRISVFVYNTPSEYLYLKEAIDLMALEVERL